MTKTVEAVYENGVLRPLEPLEGLEDRCRVRVTVESVESPRHLLADCIGILPTEDAEQMQRIIESEFEEVNLSEWQ